MEKQVVIDWSGVHAQDYKILILSIPVFLIYALIIILICSYEESIIAGMLFLLIQLVFGMSLTRIYHQLGNKAKAKLMLLDPSKLPSGWTLIQRETHAANISGIFEKFLSSLSEADKKSTDDVNDIAWFLIAVWAMASTLFALTWGIFFPACLASVGFLLFVCFITYYEGHKGLVNGYFEDEIDHLEYHIHSRLDNLTSLHPNVRSFVSWKVKNGKMVLNDFCVSFELESSTGANLRCYLGIPSKEKERVIIKCGKIMNDVIKRKIRELISNEWVWRISQTDDQTIEVVNVKDVFDLSTRGSFVRTPEKPAYLTRVVKDLLGIIQS